MWGCDGSKGSDLLAVVLYWWLRGWMMNMSDEKRVGKLYSWTCGRLALPRRCSMLVRACLGPTPHSSQKKNVDTPQAHHKSGPCERREVLPQPDKNTVCPESLRVATNRLAVSTTERVSVCFSR